MKEDRAKHKILPPSKFGLIQITRQRVRPEMNIKTREENPSGTQGNEVEAPIVLIDKISEEIERLLNKGENNINFRLGGKLLIFSPQKDDLYWVSLRSSVGRNDNTNQGYLFTEFIKCL